jgi:tetratricopeptide (TPR) repeat protein
LSFLSLAVSAWGAAILVGWHRIDAGSDDADAEGSLAAAMSEAEAAFLRGKLEEALRLFRAIEVPEGNRTRQAQKHHNIGVICLRLERWEEARDAFLAAIRANPNDAAAYVSLGRLSIREGDLEAARKHLAEALKINPNDLDARLLLAQCYGLLGDLGRAEAELRQAEANAGSDERMRSLVRQLREGITPRVSVPR